MTLDNKAAYEACCEFARGSFSNSMERQLLKDVFVIFYDLSAQSADGMSFEPMTGFAMIPDEELGKYFAVSHEKLMRSRDRLVSSGILEFMPPNLYRFNFELLAQIIW